jgi:hypothetical protein
VRRARSSLSPPPQDAAFKAAGLTKDAIAKADPATLKSILLYHSVPGYRPIPKGFTSGKPVPTLLKGSDLTVVLSEEKMAGGYRLGHATVKDAAGSVANVVAPNQFVLSSTVHAIDKVLSPAAGKAGAATATKAPAPKSMAAAAPKMAGRHRRLLGFREGGDLFNGLASNNAHDAVLAAVSTLPALCALGAFCRADGRARRCARADGAAGGRGRRPTAGRGASACVRRRRGRRASTLLPPASMHPAFRPLDFCSDHSSTCPPS